MDLEVRHLRVVCAIADAGSVRKAARLLGTTQPALTTQLTRIEKTLGGRLFSRTRSGSHPTPLGRVVLTHARSVIEGLDTLVAEVRMAVGRAPENGVRLGSTFSRVIPRWLRRARARTPDAEISIHIDGSARTLLEMMDDGQLDAAFVHEVEGTPLRLPLTWEARVLVEREPVFIALSDDHPSAQAPEVKLADLATDRWMLDTSIEEELQGVRRMFEEAGLPEPVFAHSGDPTSVADLICAGEVVSPCQPVSLGRPGMTIRPLHGDPLAVRLLLVSAAGFEGAENLFTDLKAAYLDAALAAPAYRTWLENSGRAMPSEEGLLSSSNW
ncbi:LysR family transcriptional regulator [Spirillospora sp. CA-294931]|uniref:LysR family transcriptional regulator n=1 Tax=Spirillospora sp. CA-294931 TaxID=3240042 RepID=UPI003D8F9B6D